MSGLPNTLFTYRYTDGANWKVETSVVFSGQARLEDHDRIRRAMIDPETEADEESFIPGLVGLQDLQNQFNLKELAIVDAILAADVGRDGQRHLSAEDRARYQAIREEMTSTPPKWHPDHDHVWHTLEDIRLTDRAPTDSHSLEAFITDLEAATWDESYTPPFHDEMCAAYAASLDTSPDEESPE